MLSELVRNELEAVKAIYGVKGDVILCSTVSSNPLMCICCVWCCLQDDFRERPSVWKTQPCFVVTARPYSPSPALIFVETLLKFKLVNAYPKVPAAVEVNRLSRMACMGHSCDLSHIIYVVCCFIGPLLKVESSKGLSTSDIQQLKELLRDKARLLVGQEMVHELVVAATSFLEARNQKPESLLEQGIIRRTREEEALRSFRMDASMNTHNDDDDDDDDDVGDPPTVAVESNHKVSVASKPVASQKASSLPLPSTAEKGQSWLREFISTIDDDGDADDADGDYDDAFIDEGRLHAFSDGVSFGREAVQLQRGGSYSRYLQEFVEIGQLGAGSSGQVCKVRNRLDRRVYAIKKIDLTAADNASAGTKIRREVTTISRLIHKHVVRYFAAWVEQYDHAASQQSSESATSSASAFQQTSVPSLEAFQQTSVPSLEAYRMMDEPSTHHESSRYSTDSEDEAPADHGGEKLAGLGLEDRPVGLLRAKAYNKFFHDGPSSSDDESGDGESSVGPNAKLAARDMIDVGESSRPLSSPPMLSARRCLFIQMEYCYTTLRQVVDNGKLWSQHDEIFKLLRQVLEALQYVHERGVIHRDLKVGGCAQ